MSNSTAADTTYRAHSQDPQLDQANRAFIARGRLDGARRLLDLACGPGAIAEILLEARPEAHLNGIDLDPKHIDLCVDRFARLGYDVRRGFEIADAAAGGKPVVTFAVGSADDLPFPDDSFDCVTIANAIHLLPDKAKLVAAVARVLKPAGVFGFNTAFFPGALPDRTHAFYTEWLKASTLYIGEENQRRKAAGLAEIKRVRDKTKKAFQNRWYSPDEWRGMLADSDLTVDDSHVRTVMLDGEFFATIGAYSGLAETLMSGFPVELACQAMASTARPTLAALSLSEIPRNWLEVWATKA